MEIPVYKITIDPNDDITGLDAISLVEYPAVEVDFLAFSKDKKLKMQFEDEERHIITGVALLADVPIYRVAPDGTEYNVVFSKESISQIIEKYSKMQLGNNVNIEHNDNAFVDNIFLVESYIKDSNRGIVPEEFSDIPDGSWIVSYKVENDEVWDKIKSGEVKGFSVQGIFNLIEQKFSKDNLNISFTPEEPIDCEKECRELLNKLINKLN